MFLLTFLSLRISSHPSLPAALRIVCTRLGKKSCREESKREAARLRALIDSHDAECRWKFGVDADAERGAGHAGSAVRGASARPAAEGQPKEDTVHCSCSASPSLQKQGHEGGPFLLLSCIIACRSDDM